MATVENPHAGQGSVVLDIGGDIGALIVTMPAWMNEIEVEIVPTGTDARSPEMIHEHAGTDIQHALDDHSHADDSHGDHSHADHSHGDHSHGDHSHADHSHGDHSHADHSHADHEHPHGDASHHHHPAAPPHVAVVARPTPSGSVVYSLVYGELLEGTYDLYIKPDGPIRLTATVTGGEITEAVWPDTRSTN